MRKWRVAMKVKVESVAGSHISGQHEGELVFVSNIGQGQRLVARRSDGSLVGISADDEMVMTYHPVRRQVMQSRPSSVPPRPSPSVPPFSRPKTTQ
jgi:hypothetical protein